MVLAGAAPSPVLPPIVAPAGAARVVTRTLAQPRYTGLRQGPSWQERLELWLLQGLAWLLSRLGRLGWVPAWGVLMACAALLAGAAVWALRPGLRRTRRMAQGAPSLPLGTRADHFAAADRLAAGGDLGSAVRELAAGVAAALGQERIREEGPLTVREIFARSSDPGRLGPLLTAFEAAAYGSRPPDRDAYAWGRRGRLPIPQCGGMSQRARLALVAALVVVGLIVAGSLTQNPGPL